MPEIFRAGVALYLVDRVSRGIQSMGRSFNMLGRDAQRANMSIEEVGKRYAFSQQQMLLRSAQLQQSIRLAELGAARRVRGLQGDDKTMAALRVDRAKTSA